MVMASSSNRVRGCRGLGRMLESVPRGGSSSGPGHLGGDQRAQALPSPLRRATADLLG